MMTIYLERSSTVSLIKVTCLQPVYLGYINTGPLSLASPCKGRIASRAPQGYWVDMGGTKGFFKTNLPLTEGLYMNFWIAREEIKEKGGLCKPARLQASPLNIPLDLYDGLAFIKAYPHLRLHLDSLEVFQWLQGKQVKNPLKLHQTSSPPFEIKELWRTYKEDILAWEGGHLIVEEGRTLTAIDVNSSVYGEGGARVLKSIDDISRYWLEVIPILIETIRLKHLAGMIIVDLPRIQAGKGDFLLKKFMSHLKSLEIKSLGLTRGGLWELIRPRRIPSLKQQES